MIIIYKFIFGLALLQLILISAAQNIINSSELLNSKPLDFEIINSKLNNSVNSPKLQGNLGLRLTVRANKLNVEATERRVQALTDFTKRTVERSANEINTESNLISRDLKRWSETLKRRIDSNDQNTTNKISNFTDEIKSDYKNCAEESFQLLANRYNDSRNNVESSFGPISSSLDDLLNCFNLGNNSAISSCTRDTRSYISDSLISVERSTTLAMGEVQRAARNLSSTQCFIDVRNKSRVGKKRISEENGL